MSAGNPRLGGANVVGRRGIQRTIFGVEVRADNVAMRAFIPACAACVGRRESDHAPAPVVLCQLHTGDVVFACVAGGHGTVIRAVGVVNYGSRRDDALGAGPWVRWAWQGAQPVEPSHDEHRLLGAALFEERDPRVQGRVIELLLARG